jgi:hypothetical protein
MKAGLHFILWLIISVPLQSQSAFQTLYSGSPNTTAANVVTCYEGGFALGATMERQGNTDFVLIRTNDVGDTLWTRGYGNPWDDVMVDMLQTRDSGFVMAGATQNPVIGMQDDVYIIKVDSSGELQWTFTWPDLGVERIWSFIETTDDGLIFAGFSDTLLGKRSSLIFKLDKNGTLQWNKNYKASPDEVVCYHSIDECSSGGYILCGHTYATSALSLMRIDSAGNIQWLKTYQDSIATYGSHVHESIGGKFFVTGGAWPAFNDSTMAFAGEIGPTGNVIWLNYYRDPTISNSILDIIDLPNNNHILVGYTIWPATSQVVMCIQPGGACSYAYNYDHGPEGALRTGTQTADGGFVFLGEYAGGVSPGLTSLFLLKTDSSAQSPCGYYSYPISVLPFQHHDSTLSPLIQAPMSPQQQVPQIWSGLNVVSLCVTGIEEDNSLTPAIFPNPIVDVLQMKFTTASEREIYIYNNMGELVFGHVISGYEFTLMTAQWPPGMYYYRISDNQSAITTGSIIKLRE